MGTEMRKQHRYWTGCHPSQGCISSWATETLLSLRPRSGSCQTQLSKCLCSSRVGTETFICPLTCLAGIYPGHISRMLCPPAILGHSNLVCYFQASLSTSLPADMPLTEKQPVKVKREISSSVILSAILIGFFLFSHIKSWIMYYLSAYQNPKVITNCPEQKAGQKSCSEKRRLLIFDMSKIFDSKLVFFLHLSWVLEMWNDYIANDNFWNLKAWFSSSVTAQYQEVGLGFFARNII